MNTLNQYFKQNKKIFLTLFCFWLTGVVCALFCASDSAGKQFEAVTSYIFRTFEEQTPFSKTLQNAVMKNICFFIFAVICSSHICFIPLTVSAASFKGFATTLTATFFLRIYKWKGFFPTFISIILPLVFSLPALFAMLVCSVAYPVQRRENLKRGIPPVGKHWLSHLFTLSVLLCYLCVVSIAEALFSMLLFYML